MEQITTEFVTGLRDKAIADLKAQMAEHEELTLVLAEYEGRPLSKRLKLGKFRLIDGDIYGVFRHFVKSPIKVASLKHSNSPNWQPDKIARLEGLDINGIVSVFGAIENHFNALKDLFGEVHNRNFEHHVNPLYYDLLRAIHEDDAPSHTNVNLGNFFYIRTR